MWYNLLERKGTKSSLALFTNNHQYQKLIPGKDTEGSKDMEREFNLSLTYHQGQDTEIAPKMLDFRNLST
jgi:hypothetical protein